MPRAKKIYNKRLIFYACRVIKGLDIQQSYSIGKHTIPVLHGIDLHINAGECVFLCGASGAGKTTLMYTLAGLEKPQGGQVLINDIDVYRLSSAKRARLRNRHMGFIFQNYLLMPELTALENALLGQSIAGKHDKTRVMELLVQVGLEKRLDHLPNELSGGEQQRVAIARALANDPDIIFADEPTGNLDSKNGKAILEILLKLARDNNKTLVMVTHDAHLTHLADRVIELEDGSIKQAAGK